MDIYVGNITYDTDDQTLRELFEEHGTVDRVKVVYDHYTGKSKGFAFVTMSDWKEAQSAIKALDNFELGGRPLRVNQARKREDRPGGQDDFRRQRY